MSSELEASALRSNVPCPLCGIALLRTAEGELCTACLFAAGLATDEERVGPYILLQPLDTGGTGTVHIAKRIDHEGLVAIKLARPDLVETPEALAAFRTGVRIQMALRNLPNIVRIDDLGTHLDGRPYAVMPLLEGGTLADREPHHGLADPARALDLMIKIAQAVALAHQRGVLHCDIKPANVLFDAEGRPFVSDFGLARTVGKSEFGRGAVFQGGTVGWMSPEQALQGDLTLASDVFSLGIMLYWLLTGKLPFGEGEDFARRVAGEPGTSLRTLYKGPLWWELDLICARALHKQPGRRYRSAAEFSDDLERARTDRPIETELRMPGRRAAKWIRHHKLAALAGVELSLLLLYLPLMPLSVVHEVKSTVRSQISFSAMAQAGAVMNELRASADRLQRLALQPEIGRLIHHEDPAFPPAELVAHANGVDGLSVFSIGGSLRARWPAPRLPHPTLTFRFRDYFQGQKRIGLAGKRDVYVARAFHSTGDEEPMLGISTPLYDRNEYVGSLLLRTRARATFGAVRMNCGAEGSCMTALLGPRDRDAEDEPLPGSIYVLAGNGLADGQELMINRALATRICGRLECEPRPSNQFEQPSRGRPLVLDDYEDPISHTRSIAALSSVGGTGLIVVVAMPNNALDAITHRIIDRIKAFLWVPVLLGLVLLGGVLAAPWLFRPRTT